MDPRHSGGFGAGIVFRPVYNKDVYNLCIKAAVSPAGIQERKKGRHGRILTGANSL
jgi:hypothetical protein